MPDACNHAVTPIMMQTGSFHSRAVSLRADNAAKNARTRREVTRNFSPAGRAAQPPQQTRSGLKKQAARPPFLRGLGLAPTSEGGAAYSHLPLLAKNVERAISA